MQRKIGIYLGINQQLPDHLEAKRIVTHFVEQINQNMVNLSKTEMLALEQLVIDYNEQRINLEQLRTNIKDMMDMYVTIEQVSHGLAAATV